MIQNLTSSALNEPVYPWAVQGTLILNIYVIRILGGLGVLVNLFFVFVFSYRTLQHKIYDFLWCRLFIKADNAHKSLAIHKPYRLLATSSFEWILLFLRLQLWMAGLLHLVRPNHQQGILTSFIDLWYSLNFKSLLWDYQKTNLFEATFENVNYID